MNLQIYWAPTSWIIFFTETPLSLKEILNSSASVDAIRPTISKMENKEKENKFAFAPRGKKPATNLQRNQVWGATSSALYTTDKYIIEDAC